MTAASSGSAWDRARAEIHGLPGGRGLNIAHEAVDRHAGGERARHVAFRWIDRVGGRRDMTYLQLAEESSRFAHALRTLGVGAGDRVVTLLGRAPELYVAVLGTLKHKSVVSPLFTTFGPEPIRQRIERSDGRVLVTTARQYRTKVAPLRNGLPRLEHVILVDDTTDGELGPGGGVVRIRDLMAGAPTEYEIVPTDAEDMAFVQFTSGTSGLPKGTVHVHDSVVAHHATATIALDLRPDDVFWCTADPAWVTGMSYGIVAPLTHGVTSLVDEAEFDAERWYRLLQDEGVTVWYTSPTALRRLIRAGAELARRYDLSQLRLVASVGEALAPDVVRWGEHALGRTVHDTWWQTETGAIMIANRPGEEIRPGSMGRPLPGVEAVLLRRGDDGRAVVRDGDVDVLDGADAVGELALRAGWPSMFRGYLHEPERYARCFADGWYLTGDVARRDADGWFWFLGRADDVITSAGHLIGPFEVECVLLDHPAVAEVGVVGVPDPVAGEVVKAFVTVAAGHEANDELGRALLGFARDRLGPTLAPRSIAFDPDLPKTASGKIVRGALRQRELARGPAPASPPRTAP